MQSPDRQQQKVNGSLQPAPSSGEAVLRTPERDRYIPDRGSQDSELSRYILTSQEKSTPQNLRQKDETDAEEPYASLLARSLFKESGQTTVLGLHPPNSPTKSEVERYRTAPGVIYVENKARNFRSQSFRVIPQTPERILDAPELLDDFYLNLIDWSSRNILTVALSQTVYLWNAETGEIQQLMANEDRDNIITSVCFHPEGGILAVGANDATVQLWDTVTQKVIRTIQGHTARVGSLSWNGSVLSSGSRDSTIRLHDTRGTDCAGVYQGHSQEVCGLRWSPQGMQLASGGNDNVLNIWDFRRETMECRPLFQLRQHTAAIKALAWNPVHAGLLASGGGTADKTLRFWNTSTGVCQHCVDTKSQICGALWSHSGTEIVTSHGYSDNQLTFWKYPSLRKITDLTGHSSRVLHLAMSPDGQVVVSAAGDETIRFWRCFPSVPHKKAQPTVDEDNSDCADFGDALR